MDTPGKSSLELAYNGDRYAFIFVYVATRITIMKTDSDELKEKCIDMTAAALNDFSTFPCRSIPVGQRTATF
jgi:hypothetical protein